MKCDNKLCGYDFAANPLDIRVQLKPDLLSLEVPIYCPVCGKRQAEALRIGALGVCERSQPSPHKSRNFVQWKEAEQKLPMFTISGATVLSIDDVCFAEVPVFRHYNERFEAAHTVPTLPVKPEFLELVDMEAFRKREKEYRGQVDDHKNLYVCQLPLKGLETPLRVERPLVNATWNQGPNAKDAPIGDTVLSVWPRVRCPEWKSFIVDVEAPESAVLGPAEVFVRLHALSPEVSSEQENTEPLRNGVFKLKPLVFDGFARQSAPTPRYAGIFQGARPELVAVQWSRGDRTIGGAFIALAPFKSDELHPGPQMLEVGIDFGTSNSCVAFKFGNNAAAATPVRDTYEHLVRGHDPNKYAPPSRAQPRFSQRPFGEQREIFASELLMRRPPTKETADIDRLRPGLDIAPLGLDLDWNAGGDFREELVMGGLKWTAGNPVLQRYQVAYLKALSIQTLAARLIESEESLRHVPERVDVAYSFPGIWSTDEKAALDKAIKDAWNLERDPKHTTKWAVSEWFSPSRGFSKEKSATPESFAAARLKLDYPHAADPALDFRLRLLLDVGGGTTDIALLWLGEKNDGPRVIVESMLSAKYAGDVLIHALTGDGGESSCLRDRESAAQRRIRAGGDRETIFSPEKHGTRDARINLYWRQLAEYAARLISAPFHSGSASRRNPHLSNETRLPVEIVRLGNGLGLAQFINNNLDSVLASELEARINHLLPNLAPRVSVRVVTVQESGIHPKHAVALGLLTSSRDFDDAGYVSADKLNREKTTDIHLPSQEQNRQPWQARSILGLDFRTTKGGTEHVVEWWREVNNLHPDGRHFPAMHGSALDKTRKPRWLPSNDEQLHPEFPSDVVQDLQGFRRALEASNEPVLERVSKDNEWFKANPSPFEALLTSGLTERLKRIKG